MLPTIKRYEAEDNQANNKLSIVPNLLFIGTPEDKAESDPDSYLRILGALKGKARLAVNMQPVITKFQVVELCKAKGYTGVISTSLQLLTLLLSTYGNSKKPSINNYAGSYFLYEGIEFVFIDPLKQLVTVPYGKHLTARYISKLTDPNSPTWNNIKIPKFKFSVLDASNVENAYFKLMSAYFIAVDIETVQEPLSIRCIGYTGLFINTAGELATESYVLPLSSMWSVTWMRKFNWELKSPKVLQNGKYDAMYLLSYSAPMYNYLWDTQNLFHCWYSELPKDLAFLNSYFIREAMYWKDLAETDNLYEYYKYNALDTWATLLVFLHQIDQMPQWAKNNYLMQFPVIYPCLLSEMTGIKRDMVRLEESYKQGTEFIEEENKSLSKMLGADNFNTNSPIQMKQLLVVLGCKDLVTDTARKKGSADERNLKKAMYRHPLNAHILNKVINIRKTRKLVSTYLSGDKEYKGRILYSISPSATDTGRCSSRESAFWCGLQIQNIPRGDSVKRTLIADEGFKLYEVDLCQAESRDTAYIVGDETYITAVTGKRDFHSVNASAFFGIPYEQIYDDVKGKTINKVIRDLAKRVNHGANYNMGPGVLIDTMGERLVWEAARILMLPSNYTLMQIAEYLLDKFHAAYPMISKVYYPSVIASVLKTKMLVGASGWTRYCFSDPSKSKQALNAYVAHNPQSLNAMTLNKAYVKVFYELALNTAHRNNFKLCAQIHDSILFQARVGHEYLAEMVRERMEVPVTVVGCDGKSRELIVPASIKAGVDGNGATYWSETE